MMIKLADSSDLGWKIAQENQRYPIADDSEDENIIIGAISKAERKTNLRRRKCVAGQLRTVKNVGRMIMLGKQTREVFYMWKERPLGRSCPDSQQSKISTFLSTFNIGLNLD
jgi:hypothetical protein